MPAPKPHPHLSRQVQKIIFYVWNILNVAVLEYLERNIGISGENLEIFPIASLGIQLPQSHRSLIHPESPPWTQGLFSNYLSNWNTSESNTFFLQSLRIFFFWKFCALILLISLMHCIETRTLVFPQNKSRGLKLHRFWIGKTQIKIQEIQNINDEIIFAHSVCKI